MVTVDDNAVIDEFGETIEFWTWDRQPLDVFMKLAGASNQDSSSMIDIVRTLVLDEDGTQIIDKDNMLPTNVLLLVIAKIVEKLGK